MSEINLNSAPYFDDYNPEKGFHRILFRPGYAVQGRELIQLQTILQEQIRRGGDFILADGSPVVGGLPTYNNQAHYIRLADTSINIGQYINHEIEGTVSGAKGKILHFKPSEVNENYEEINDPPTVIINRLNDSDFIAGEALTIYDSEGTGVLSGISVKDEVVEANSRGYKPFGRSSIVSIDEGIFYIRGYYVWTPAQTIILNKYNSIPSYRVGLKVIQEIIDDVDDETLLDPATGTPNETAPGAHRLAIKLDIDKRSVKGNLGTVTGTGGNTVNVEYGVNENMTDIENSSDVNFIELIRIVDGFVTNKVKYPELGELEHTLARRTYDQSGNYTVRPFSLEMLEDINGNINYLTAKLDSGKAYVKGYEFETDAPRYLRMNKTRDADHIDFISNDNFSANYGSYIYVENMEGMLDVNSMETVDLHSVRWFDAELNYEVEYICHMIGTARIRNVQYIGGTPGIDAVYRVFLFNIEMIEDYSFKDVKSIIRGFDKNANFVASMTTSARANLSTNEQFNSLSGISVEDEIEFNLDGSITLTDTSISFKSVGFTEGMQITISSTSTSDVLSNNIGQGGLLDRCVKRTILGFDSQNKTMYLDTSIYGLETQTVNAVIENVNAIRYGSESNNLLFPLPQNAIKSIRDELSNEPDTDYIFQKYFDGPTHVAVGGEVSLQSGVNEKFIEPAPGMGNRYYKISKENGEFINLTDATFEFSSASGVQTVKISGLDYSGDVYAIASMFHIEDAAIEKGKILKRNHAFIIENPNRKISGEDILELSDGYKLKAIYDLGDGGTIENLPYIELHETGTNPWVDSWCTSHSDGNYRGERVISESGASATVVHWNSSLNRLYIIPNSDFNVGDIVYGLESGSRGTILVVSNPNTTARNIVNSYDFDGGQKDNFYDYAKITLKSGYTPPIGNICVIVDYFVDSGGKGYFSVDSYPTNLVENYNEDGEELDENMKPVIFGYEDIPTYRSSSGGETFYLQNYMDFRPRRKDNDIHSNINLSARTFEPAEYESINTYKDEIAQATLQGIKIPEAYTLISADYSFYLGRIDKIIATKDKTFKILSGVPDINPLAPPDDKDAMTLWVVELPPYVFTPKDVKLNYVENKRYTMRDIGKLERRIENLEYYTSLNLLEKKATQQEVITIDPVTGERVERFKNGILVDSFQGHAVGDVLSKDYKCCIDFNSEILRPSVKPGHVDLKFHAGGSENVTKKGNLISLNYSETPILNQPLKSESVKINPFELRKYVGVGTLEPSTDTFYDITVRPDVTMNLEGDNDAYIGMGIGSADNRLPGFGTRWDEEILMWRGIDPQTPTRAKASTNTKVGPANSVNTGVFRTDVNRDIASADKKGTMQAITSKGLDVIEKSVGNRFVDINVVPYIRSKTIYFEAKGLKPNTTLYGFFDDVAMNNQYMTDEHGTVDGVFTIPKGKFRTGEKIFRLIDDSNNDINKAETICEMVYLAAGLLSNTDERIVGTRPPIHKKEDPKQQDIPRDEASRGRVQGTAGSTKIVDGLEVFERAQQVESQTVVVSSDGTDPEEISINVPAGDAQIRNPLSQTFYVDDKQYPSGCFITSVDIAFKKKDEKLPVTVSIRPVINGFPHASYILPYAVKTLLPDDINVSDDGSVYTNVEFDSIVYLLASGVTSEYAIVLETDSAEYEVWVATIGQDEFSTNRTITSQPYIGSFYRSQNIGRWKIDPLRSLTTKINRAKFDTNSSGKAIFRNEAATEGTFSNTITNVEITNPGGGYVNGEVYSNVVEFDNSENTRITVTYDGEPDTRGLTVRAQVVNGKFEAIEIINGGDDYSLTPVIIFDAPASGTRAQAEVTEINNGNVYMDYCTVISDTLEFTETRMKWHMQFTPAIESEYDDSSEEMRRLARLHSNNSVEGDWIDIFVDQKEPTYMGQKKITKANSGSTRVRSTMVSGDDSVSPVIDEERMSVLTVENLINSMSGIVGGNNNIESELMPTGGYAKTRYISRRVSLEEGFESSMMKVYLTANKRPNTDIYVFAKFLDSNTERNFEDQPWIMLEQQQPATMLAETEDDYREYSYLPVVPFGEELTPFRAYAIKIVLAAKNTSIVPKVKELRAMSLAPLPRF